MRTLRVLTACLLFAAFPRVASAEWHLTPLAGLGFANDTNFIDPELAHKKTHKHLGGAVSFLTPGFLGVEVLGIWMPGYFQNEDAPNDLLESSRSAAIMGNLVLTAPRSLTEYTLRPYLSGGFGWLNVSQSPKAEEVQFGANVAGFNVGGGAVGFLTPRTGVRFDLRYFSSIRPGDKAAIATGEGDDIRLRYMTASIGIVFRR